MDKKNYQSKTICRYGDGWQSLSRADEDVFNVSIDEWPRLLACWMAYEVAMGIYDHGAEKATRLKFQEYRMSQDWFDGNDNEASLFQFGEQFGFTHREMSAVFCKQHFLEVRSGGIHYEDETTKHRVKKTWKKLLQFPLTKSRLLRHS